MKTIRLREARARLSTIVAAAERGEPTIITKHGRPAAMVVPVENGQHLYAAKPNLADYLLGFPGPLDTPHDPSPLRETDL